MDRSEASRAGPASARRRGGLPSTASTEHTPIIRFLIRIASFVAFIAWTALMGGAFLALVETGTVLRSLELQLGDPELEAAIYNLILFIERAGPIGLAIAWVVGMVAILVVRRLALALVGLVWRATSTWARPSPSPVPPATSAPVPPAPVRPAAQPMRLPGQAGPWNRPAPAPPASPPSAGPPSAGPPPAKPTAPSPRPIVERGLRPGVPATREGAVVLQRPRGHMDGS